MHWCRMRMVVAVLGAAAASTAMSAGQGGPEIAATLALQRLDVGKGETPEFVVTVRPLQPSVRVLNWAARSDLRQNYAQITVTLQGKVVEVPRTMADPGPITDGDYRVLKKGEQLVFRHDGAPLSLKSLAPGGYTARVQVWSDWNAAPVWSNAVAFRVRP